MRQKHCSNYIGQLEVFATIGKSELDSIALTTFRKRITRLFAFTVAFRNLIACLMECANPAVVESTKKPTKFVGFPVRHNVPAIRLA